MPLPENHTIAASGPRRPRRRTGKCAGSHNTIEEVAMHVLCMYAALTEVVEQRSFLL